MRVSASAARTESALWRAGQECLGEGAGLPGRAGDAESLHGGVHPFHDQRELVGEGFAVPGRRGGQAGGSSPSRVRTQCLSATAPRCAGWAGSGNSARAIRNGQPRH